jgi:hypothetical protein
MRLHSIVTSSAVLAVLCSMLMGGCGAGSQGDESSSPTLRDGELNGSTAVDLPEKVTICHVPPGNPANAHTLVVSVSGWENGHSHHKGDHLGPCEGESDGGVPSSEDGGTSQPDAGTPAPDAGTPGPTCAPEGAACGDNVACCDGLQCQSGSCSAIIN